MAKLKFGRRFAAVKAAVAAVCLPAVAAVPADVPAAASSGAARAARAEIRRAIAGPATRKEAIKRALTSDDAVVRRFALWNLFADDRESAFGWMETHVNDGSRPVGVLMAELSRQMPEERRMKFLGRLAEATEDESVRLACSLARGFPFRRDNVPVSLNPVNDHAVALVKSIPLPTDGWRFKHDLTAEGHIKPGYQKPEVKPRKSWPTVKIGSFWEDCPGVGRNFNGIGWYRLEWAVPEKPEGANVFELCFDGVDEEAWVWLNGEYIGQHTEGVAGWNKPFRFDVAKEIRWGVTNVVVVRVNDTANGGGIHKGVRLEAMRCDF
ncbi:MAG: hypothetical protein J6T01_01320 [Kiritimatiellae bacterium]|nr:hypothetical protein [Kiritimatiellia bacterium]